MPVCAYTNAAALHQQYGTLLLAWRQKVLFIAVICKNIVVWLRIITSNAADDIGERCYNQRAS